MATKGTKQKRPSTNTPKTQKTKVTNRKRGRKSSPVSTKAIVICVLAVVLAGTATYIATSTRFGHSVCRWIKGKDVRVYGIDLSRYQTNIKWDEIGIYYDTDRDTITFEKTHECLPASFVFLKATQGRALDKTYAEKKEEARAHGYKTGAYHVLINDTNIVNQANNFIEVAQPDSAGFPPILDIESDYVGKPYSEYRKKVLQWLQLVEDATGGKPLIYCSDKTREKVLNTPEFDAYHFWIARYDTTPPRSKDDWLFWQFTEKGKIRGIKGKVDISIWKGTAEDLENWRKSCWKDPVYRERLEHELDMVEL